MSSKKNIAFLGIVIFPFIFIISLVSLNAADTPSQVVTHIDEILKANPLKAGEKAQMIKIAQDDTVSFFVVRASEGVELKPHVHKTHDEIVYVIKGSAQMLIDDKDDKLVDVKPGSLHFNPMGKIHSSKVTSNEPYVVLSIFTPALKEPDRHFVE